MEEIWLSVSTNIFLLGWGQGSVQAFRFINTKLSSMSWTWLWAVVTLMLELEEAVPQLSTFTVLYTSHPVLCIVLVMNIAVRKIFSLPPRAQVFPLKTMIHYKYTSTVRNRMWKNLGNLGWQLQSSNVSCRAWPGHTVAGILSHSLEDSAMFHLLLRDWRMKVSVP